MPGDVKWTININTEEAKAAARKAIFEGVQEIFELDIKPDAIENSPYKTGHNRSLIDVQVVDTPRGPQAQLFSQSGYGGYLELGTRFMKARPHMYPAFNKFIGQLSEVIGAKVRAIRPSMFIGPRNKPGGKA